MTAIVLTVLPVIYFTYNDVSWKPIRPFEHLIQNGLAYIFFLLFSYFHHTVFVPRWFLQKRYWRYAIVTVGCVLAASYFPYGIEQWARFKKNTREHIECLSKTNFRGRNDAETSRNAAFRCE